MDLIWRAPEVLVVEAGGLDVDCVVEGQVGESLLALARLFEELK